MGVSFTSNLYEELAARRRRLTKRFGALLGGIVEFALLGGLCVGVLAAFLGRPWGAAPIVAWVIGYAYLDSRRQRTLAAGADPAVTERSSDLIAFALTASLALIGFYAFTGAMAQKEVEGWTEPQPTTIDLEIVK